MLEKFNNSEGWLKILRFLLVFFFNRSISKLMWNLFSFVLSILVCLFDILCIFCDLGSEGFILVDG